MARTIADIQAQIIADVQSDSTLSGLNSTSVTAIWRLWTYIVASAIWALEILWDAFRIEITDLVAAQKPHTLRWYQRKALDFQYGGTLVPGEDYFDNTGVDPDDVSDQKIIAQAAAVEQSGSLIVKVAKEVGGELTALNSTENDAVVAYFGDIKDAGVTLQVRSVAADRLKIEVDVYYNATVLGSTGARLDGNNATPIQSAAKTFLRSLPFDGEFVKAHLTDALQAVDGVVVPEIRVCQARRDDDPSFASVDVFYTPYSGFLKFYTENTDLVLNFIAA